MKTIDYTITSKTTTKCCTMINMCVYVGPRDANLYHCVRVNDSKRRVCGFPTICLLTNESYMVCHGAIWVPMFFNPKDFPYQNTKYLIFPDIFIFSKFPDFSLQWIVFIIFPIFPDGWVPGYIIYIIIIPIYIYIVDLRECQINNVLLKRSHKMT
jgi:hypothetical protein